MQPVPARPTSRCCKTCGRSRRRRSRAAHFPAIKLLGLLDLVTGMIVQLSLKGIPTRFAHCRSCEHRVWTDVSEASSMTLDDVLVRAVACSGTPRPRRRGEGTPTGRR